MFEVKGRRGMHSWKVYTTVDKEKKEEKEEEMEEKQEKQKVKIN